MRCTRGGPLTIGDYSPVNYGGAVYGSMTLRSAMHRSVNTVFVRLMQDVGPAEVGRRWPTGWAWRSPRSNRLATAPACPSPSAAEEVTSLGMASAYGTFANDGIRVPPTPVVRVFAPDGSRWSTGPSPRASRC